MTLKKKLALGAGLCLVLIGAAFYLAASNLNRIAKSTIERMAPEILGVPVKVGSVDISPWKGKASVRNLEVLNPPGFKSKKLMQISKFAVQFKWESVLSGPLHIEKLELASPEIWWEGTLQDNNLKKIQQSAEHFKKERGISTSKTSEEKNVSARRYQITDFAVTGVQAHVTPTQLPGKEFHLALPPITARNLGGDKGETADRITSQIMAQFGSALTAEIQAKVLQQVVDTAREVIRDRLRDMIQDRLRRH